MTTIAEPTTMITDYALCALATFFAARLLHAGQRERRLTVVLWGAGLAALACGALAGGTSHGFAPALSTRMYALLWKTSLYSIGLLSLFLLCAALAASFSGTLRRILMLAATVKFVAYAAWVTTHDAFRWAVFDYSLSMTVILCLQLFCWRRRGAASGTWIAAGIVVSFAAAGIQRSGVTLHRYFNHNDLYHVVQMVGLYLLYRGGMRLDEPSTTRPSEPSRR